MLILLPPSETKRDGGDPSRTLDLSSLAFAELTRPRRSALDAIRRLAADRDASATALKLGATQGAEIARNRTVLRSPVMPALDRYDGVLYEALDAASLTAAQRTWAGQHVAIASAAFGLTMGLDEIPAYRLSHDSRIPGLSLARLWRAPLAAVLEQRPGLILDLRSEAYAALGPLPPRTDAVFVRVVTEDGSGRRRALNHFNKKGKGEFVRRLILSQPDLPDPTSLQDWAAAEGVRLLPGAPGELDLVV
ncbi:MAG: YaaA family protein [Pseudolysinimonas sp.]